MFGALLLLHSTEMRVAMAAVSLPVNDEKSFAGSTKALQQLLVMLVACVVGSSYYGCCCSLGLEVGGFDVGNG